MHEIAPTVYVNGRLLPEGEASVSVLDRGLTLADGLFETMVAFGDRVFRLPDHLARLRGGAALLRLPLPPSRTLEAAVRETLRRNGRERSVVRLTVTRGSDHGRGLDVRPGTRPTLIVRVTPWQGPPSSLPLPGRSLALSPICRNEHSPITRVKSLAYVEGVVARLEVRRRGADDALLLNTTGTVACASSSNVFVVIDDALATPRQEDGALPGIARKTLLEVARSLGMAAREQSIQPEEVYRAREVVLTNVVSGPVPVTSVDGHPVGDGAPGPVTARLTRAYWELVAKTLGG